MSNWWGYPNPGLNQWKKDYLVVNEVAFFVPEPSAILLLGIATVGLVVLGRCRACPIPKLCQTWGSPNFANRHI